MARRFGLVAVPAGTPPGTAAVRVSLQDTAVLDAPAVAGPRLDLLEVTVEGGGSIPFEIDDGDPARPGDITIRVHIDRDGSGRIAPGDLLTTEAVSLTRLGATSGTAGRVPVTAI